MSVNLFYQPTKLRKSFKSSYTSNTICILRDIFPNMTIGPDDLATLRGLLIGSSYLQFWQELVELVEKHGEIRITTEV